MIRLDVILVIFALGFLAAGLPFGCIVALALLLGLWALECL